MQLSMMIDVIVTSLQPDPGTVGVCLIYRVTGHIKEYQKEGETGFSTNLNFDLIKQITEDV